VPRIVKLTADLRPFRKGEDAVLPDEVAARLIKSGEATNSRPYPPSDVSPAIPVSAAQPRRSAIRKRA
jgi:hypothetical protein